MCLSENKITWGKILNFVLLTWFVLDKCDAKTGAICMIAFSILLVFIRYFKGKLKGNWIYYILNSANIVLAVTYIAMTHLYDVNNVVWFRINELLSKRLENSSSAIALYDYKLFGQTIDEIGFGGTIEQFVGYFFIDDSFLRIALKYGVVLLVVVLAIFWCSGMKAIKSRRMIIVAGIAIIALHSFMEHHLILPKNQKLRIVLQSDMSRLICSVDMTTTLLLMAEVIDFLQY